MKVANLGRAVKFNRGGDIMKRDKLLMIVAVFGVLSMMLSVPIRQAYGGRPPLLRRLCSRRLGQRKLRLNW